MSGPAFMRPYPQHNGHWIKQADESKTGTPTAIADDLELFAPLKPLTIYMFHSVIYFSGASISASNVVLPAFTAAVDCAAIFYHRPSGDDATEKWNTALNGDHRSTPYDTTMFNAQTGLYAGQRGARRMYGVIQTGGSGGTFSIKWGGGNDSRTVEAGSFMYLQEALTY